jgi:hypothetical protein
MAVEYLQEGASSFAVANWFEIDGTTAGAGFTSGALLIVPGGGTSIVSDLDWSTLGGGNTGITYLKIAERFSGNIGTATAPLKVDADVADTEYATNEVSASGRIEHYGPGNFYISAAGGSAKISNFFQMGVGRTIVIAGTVAYLYQANGTVQVEAGSLWRFDYVRDEDDSGNDVECSRRIPYDPTSVYDDQCVRRYADDQYEIHDRESDGKHLRRNREPGRARRNGNFQRDSVRRSSRLLFAPCRYDDRDADSIQELARLDST